MELLSAAGLIHNTSMCFISTEEIRSLSELDGKTMTTLDTPHFYIPDTVSAVASHELPLLDEITLKEIMQIDEI
jgi:hypothetical protein